jgi:hypothetical protein
MQAGSLCTGLITVATSCYDEVVNVVVEWLALLIRIREVPGSDLSPESGYPD